MTKKLEIDPKRVEATETFEAKPSRLDGETLKRDSRMKWLNPW